MKREIIEVANLKCNGCSNTIKNKLTTLKGVHQVSVNLNDETVIVDYDHRIELATITKKLLQMGYPELAAENGMVQKIKSFASCIAGSR